MGASRLTDKCVLSATMKLKRSIHALILSFAVVLASVTNAGHWHEGSTFESDCVVCLQDTHQEAITESDKALTQHTGLFKTASTHCGVALTAPYSCYQPRAPPITP
jgi:hypothetical protein